MAHRPHTVRRSPPPSVLSLTFQEGLRPVASHSVTATATHAYLTSACCSGAYSFTIDTAPSVPTITGISDDTGTSLTDGITVIRRVSVSGTGADGDTITVTSLALRSPGQRSCPAAHGLADFTGVVLIGGGLSLRQRRRTRSGNASAVVNAVRCLVDRTAPTLTIYVDQPALEIGGTATITFKFTEDPGTTVHAR